MNPPRQQVGSIPGLAKQMTPPGLVPGNPGNLPFPDAASMANSDMGQRAMASYYGDTLVVGPPVPFEITQPATEMDHLRHRTFGFRKGGPDALQHGPSPMQLAMGGGEPGDGRQGIELGLTQSAGQPQGKHKPSGMNTSLGTTRPMLGVG
jgi:hypothetical protein